MSMNPQDAARRDRMGLLACTAPARLAQALPELPDHELLRAPEIGAVMVRGRAGATGAPFNLGEMTVTRCTLVLACGTQGHAVVQGRDRDHARRAALIDALAARGECSELLAELRAEEAARRAARAEKAAATRVEFFTMVRGED